MTPPDDPRKVRITVDKDSAVYWLDDDAPPSLDAGYGGWDDQERDRRRALLTWGGAASWRLNLGVMLDAYDEDGKANIDAFRAQWKVLRALWTTPHPGEHPPLAKLEGRTLTQVLPQATDAMLNWALTGVSPRLQVHADTNGVGASGELIRWAGTLTFGHVAPSEILRITQGPNAGKRIHVVKAGETLKGIAKAEEVNVKEIRWASGKKSGQLIRDPNTKVIKDDRLWLPPRTKSKKKKT